jgi:hypothetical protein
MFTGAAAGIQIGYLPDTSKSVIENQRSRLNYANWEKCDLLGCIV